MLNKASFLAVTAIAALALAAASPSYAHGDKKSGPIFNKPSNSSSSHPSSSSSSSSGCCKDDHHHHHDKYYVYKYYPYSYRPPVVPVQTPTVVAPKVVTVPAPAPSCLTKEYLQNNTIMFKDTCTKEWAMNTTTLSAQPVNKACLVKEHPQNGVVLFRDTCTNEWARNPQDQQAQGPETSQSR